MKAVVATLGLAILPVGSLFAAEPTAGRFRADANVVLINATVLDRQDHPVRGLSRDQFRLFEDKMEQSIAYFSEEEAPVSVAVIFDTSGSMGRKTSPMRAALDAVLRSANNEDEFSLITFADGPQITSGWTRSTEEIQNRLLFEVPRGQTALLDAIHTGLRYLKHAKNSRRAMVIFSDGGDNHSRRTESEVRRSLEEADVEIYALNAVDLLPSRSRAAEEMAGPRLLDRLCDRAGGRYFEVDSRRDMDLAAEKISHELRSQYVIGYVPPWSNADGRFHRVRVQIEKSAAKSKLSVFWRRGYRAPGALAEIR